MKIILHIRYTLHKMHRWLWVTLRKHGLPIPQFLDVSYENAIDFHDDYLNFEVGCILSNQKIWLPEHVFQCELLRRLGEVYHKRKYSRKKMLKVLKHVHNTRWKLQDAYYRKRYGDDWYLKILT